MAILVFPDITPEYIKSISPPNYNVSKAEFKNADKRFKRTQFVGAGTELDIEFRYLPISQVDQIITLWDDTEGRISFTLPTGFYRYLTTEVVTMIADWKATTRWLISEAPAPQPIIWCGNAVANVCDLDLTLISTIC